MNAAWNLLNRIREKNLHLWVDAFALDRARNLLSLPPRRPRHLLFAFCDHFEPLWGGASKEVGDRRVEAWVKGYPRMAGLFHDSEGRPPRHSFFFPGEQYAPSFLEGLADLARGGFGEVELHLHHGNDTAENLRGSIQRYLSQLAGHGHLSRDRDGTLRYGFIHGDWSLANAGAPGRCGVDEELPLLHETGCYADFTFPAAPDPCQPRIVNRVYWPTGDLSRRRAFDRGERARVGRRRDDRLLMIQGPLALAFETVHHRPRVRIENGNVAGDDPVTNRRIRTWVAQNIHVAGQPQWVFVKVHTHGALEPTASSLLFDGGRTLHGELCTRYNDGQDWVLHYVTAREMFNIAIAAMEGRVGDPGAYRDHVLPPPPITTRNPRGPGG